MAEYKLTEAGVKRIADGAFIPNDTRNGDWRKYQAWLGEGNTPDPEFTEEEIAEQTKQANRQQILNDLRGADRLLLKMVVALYQVLRTADVVVASDFDPELIAEVQAYRQKVQDYEDIG